jgi:hypothetical protein
MEVPARAQQLSAWLGEAAGIAQHEIPEDWLRPTESGVTSGRMGRRLRRLGETGAADAAPDIDDILGDDETPENEMDNIRNVLS